MHVHSAIAVVLTLLGMMGARTAPGEDIPRPEHPRPQMERAEWLNLNGAWEFAESAEPDDARFLGEGTYPERITVPFCRESPLSGIGRREFVKNVWYRRTFEVPENWTAPRVRLHIGACDWKTRVWVNGEFAGEHVGGNTAFSFDITDSVRRAGENTVVVHAYDDTASGLQPLGKQSIRGESFGIFYTPTTGIWQTVWLEGVGETFIREFRVNTDPARARLGLEVDLDGPAQGLAVQAEAMLDGRVVGRGSVDAAWRDNRFEITLSEARAWSPASPVLYDLRLSLTRDGVAVDSVGSYFGLRRVTIEGMAMLVNGQAIFQRLVLDQGFYPDGIWTAPTDEALRRDIELSMAAGFNGARLHQKVFEPRFLYWADRLGYLVWGEYPSFGANYADPAVNEPYIREWVEIVARDFNHPAVIGWCPFNETPPEAGDLQHAVVELTRRLDPSRPCLETSGWSHHLPNPEVFDAHDYNQDPASFRDRWLTAFAGQVAVTPPERYGVEGRPGVPFFVSEYGGIGWSLDPNAWGYGSTPESLDAFYARFAGLTRALMDSRYHCGLCYTQLTNVEQEQNGVYMFDRSEKFDVAPLREVLSQPAAYELDPPVRVAATPMDWAVLIGARMDPESARPWSYTEKEPAAGWEQPDFDDSAWETGRSPFGNKEGIWMETIRTPWRSTALWARQRFIWDGEPFDAALLIIHYDEDAEVLVNGRRVWKRARWNDALEPCPVTEAVRDALRPGQNTITVSVRQDRGGQYLDLALLLGRAAARQEN